MALVCLFFYVEDIIPGRILEYINSQRKDNIMKFFLLTGKQSACYTLTVLRHTVQLVHIKEGSTPCSVTTIGMEPDF